MRGPRPRSSSGVSLPHPGICPPSPKRLEPNGGQGQGHFAGNPRPSWALATPRGSRANAAPSGSSAPFPARAGPSRAPHSGKPGLPAIPDPSFGLCSPGSPCRTASSAPPPTSCLSPSDLPPRPSKPEGQRKRQAPRRRRPPARLSGLCRRRLRRPLASSATAPAAASARRAPARPGYYMATAHFRPRVRTCASCRPAGSHARRLRRERPLLPASGPGRA